MKKKRAAAALVVVAACLSSPAQAQAPGGAERPAVLKAARELMEKARFCALVTIGEDGHPQARAVDAFAPAEDMTVWIATNPVTRKVRELAKDTRATLYYYEPSGPGYVTVLGRAVVVSDPAEKAKRWKDDWAAYYKDRNRGDDYVLIRVTPFRLEIAPSATATASQRPQGRFPWRSRSPSWRMTPWA
jgi:PPOX class probable F420-dependent enzyme